ncbi:MAG: DUF1501 domain-containing protein [Planctomycetaceae bacterium]|nr:DUF1501 domain-containing protein [Planctomycetaceae bacterium]
MLNILGNASRRSAFCDGVSRRGFLKIGGMVMGGMSLPQLLRVEAKAGIQRSHKAVIMIFLPGGPPHQDMWDLKTEAPSEIRGPLQPISTSVSGIQICELFPKIAQRMDRFVPIRSIVGASGRHAAFQCMTGRRETPSPSGGWPSVGSTLSHLQGPVDPNVPPYVSLCYKTSHVPWGDPGRPGFLGVPNAPFRPMADGKEDMILNGITLERLQDRKGLLQAFDRLRRDIDHAGMVRGLDAFQHQALDVLTSSKLIEALDISREDKAVAERYGTGDPKPRADGAPKMVENFLIARRLVEAGARCVTLNFSRWDWHGGNFTRAKQDMPMLDGAVTALVDDLHERGLDQDVSVVVWGEFGRTPKINNNAGRDHWPNVSCALLAGGGMKTGQVIGATDRIGGEAVDRPVTFQEVIATLYHNLGIDLDATTVNDLTGRPRYLVDSDAAPIAELI